MCYQCGRAQDNRPSHAYTLHCSASTLVHTILQHPRRTNCYSSAKGHLSSQHEEPATFSLPIQSKVGQWCLQDVAKAETAICWWIRVEGMALFNNVSCTSLQPELTAEVGEHISPKQLKYTVLVGFESSICPTSQRLPTFHLKSHDTPHNSRRGRGRGRLHSHTTSLLLKAPSTSQPSLDYILITHHTPTHVNTSPSLHHCGSGGLVGLFSLHMHYHNTLQSHLHLRLLFCFKHTKRVIPLTCGTLTRGHLTSSLHFTSPQ